MKQYVFKTDKVYKINPEVVIVVTVLHGLKTNFLPQAIWIFFMKLFRCDLGIELVYID